MRSYVKYPRTLNLPWSGSESSDDVWLENCDHFRGSEIIVLEKIDGENTTIYSDGHTHARSLDSSRHPSRSWVKSLAGRLKSDIPTGWRICGENVFAMHSILYRGLPSYFLVFSIFDENDICLDWDQTLEYCELMGLTVVPTIYRGKFDNFDHRKWTGESAYSTYRKNSNLSENPEYVISGAEGYVIRSAESFPIRWFPLRVAKFVVPHHVRTSTHWMFERMVVNQIRELP